MISGIPQFEWDEQKNKTNQGKHKVRFEDAVDIFNAPDRINYKSDREGEQRFRTLGKALNIITIVIFTIRKLAVRIISARRAGKQDRRLYLSKKLSKQDDDTK